MATNIQIRKHKRYSMKKKLILKTFILNPTEQYYKGEDHDNIMKEIFKNIPKCRIKNLEHVDFWYKHMTYGKDLVIPLKLLIESFGEFQKQNDKLDSIWSIDMLKDINALLAKIKCIDFTIKLKKKQKIFFNLLNGKGEDISYSHYYRGSIIYGACLMNKPMRKI